MANKFTKLNIGYPVASSGKRALNKLCVESEKKSSIVGTWVLNDTLIVPESASVIDLYFDFCAELKDLGNGKNEVLILDHLSLYYKNGIFEKVYYGYMVGNTGHVYPTYYPDSGFTSPEAKTIYVRGFNSFTEDEDLVLTWLSDNATKISDDLSGSFYEAEKWVFHDQISIPDSTFGGLRFLYASIEGRVYKVMDGFKPNPRYESSGVYNTLCYTTGDGVIQGYHENRGWTNVKLKTVYLLEPITDPECKAWLEANATKINDNDPFILADKDGQIIADKDGNILTTR